MTNVLRIQLSKSEKRRLESLRKSSPDARVVRRSNAILMSDQGIPASKIASKLKISTQTVSDYRRRWREHNLGSLEDKPRPGRPAAAAKTELYETGADWDSRGSQTPSGVLDLRPDPSPVAAPTRPNRKIPTILLILFVLVLGGGLFLVKASSTPVGRTPDRQPPADAESLIRHAGGRADLDRAFELNPRVSRVRWLRSEAYELRAKEAMEQGDDPIPELRRAVVEMTATLAVEGVKWPGLQRRAELFARIGEARIAWGENGRAAFDDALRDIEAIAPQEPPTIERVRLRGNVRLFVVLESRSADPRATELLRKAVEDFTEVIRRIPEDQEAHLQRGRARHLQGTRHRRAGQEFLPSFKAAEGDYTWLIQSGGDAAWAHRKRGAVREQLGDSGGALADWNRAVELRPEWKAELEPLIARVRGLINSGDADP